MKEAGVTWVSMGSRVLTRVDAFLASADFMTADGHRSGGDLVEAEFACVKFDFIYGLPGQTAESLSGSLERAMALAFHTG